MKTVIFSYIILAIIIILVITNSLIVSHSIEIIIEKLRGIPDSSTAETEYSEILDYYIKTQRFWGITVSHDDLTAIESDFYEILGAAKAHDDEALIIAKSRLIGALTHLKRLVGINSDSILFNHVSKIRFFYRSI